MEPPYAENRTYGGVRGRARLKPRRSTRLLTRKLYLTTPIGKPAFLGRLVAGFTPACRRIRPLSGRRRPSGPTTHARMMGNRPPGTPRRTDLSIPKGCRAPSPPRNRNSGTSCRHSRCPTPHRASRGSCICSASSVSSPEVRKIVVYHHPRAAFAPGRIVAEGHPQALGPCVALRHPGELRRREEQPGLGLGLAFVRVEAVVPYLLEPLVGDVDEQPFDEVLGALGDILPPPLLGLVPDVVVLVRVVEPGDRHRHRVEGGYPPLRDGGVGGVPGDVARQSPRRPWWSCSRARTSARIRSIPSGTSPSAPSAEATSPSARPCPGSPCRRRRPSRGARS